MLLRVHTQRDNQNKSTYLRTNMHNVRTMTKQIRCVNWRIKISKHKIKKFHSAELEAFPVSDQLTTWATPPKAGHQEAPPGCRVFLPWEAEPHLPQGNQGFSLWGSLSPKFQMNRRSVTLWHCPFVPSVLTMFCHFLGCRGHQLSSKIIWKAAAITLLLVLC